MRNNKFSPRAGAGASGRDKRDYKKPYGGNRSDAKPFNKDRSDAKPYDRDSKPFDRDRKPFDRDRKPFDRDRKPFDRDRKPFDRDRKPFDRDSKPFDRDRKPFDRDRKPFDRDRKPFDRDRKPFDRDRKPFDRDRKPFDRDRKPFDRDSKPFDRDRKPFDRDRKPFDRDSKPFDRDRKPFDRDRKPFDRDRKPFDSESTPVKDNAPFMRSRRPKNNPEKTNDGTVRLNKFISNSGICSRREADEYITAGLVTVNGEVVTQLGVKVTYNDEIRFNGERLKGEEKVYILLNKPKDYVTTMSDPNAERTVMELIEGKCSQRVYPVGRLDKMTTGVLLLTNDGEIAERLTHPSNNQKKIYHVFLDKNLSGIDFDNILKGLTLEDGPVHADALSYVDGEKDQVGLEIHSGRNRVVRRIFEHLGYKVKKLDRVFFAGLTKKNLRRGQWRFLTEQEVAMLRMGAYE
ncbi:MAG: pseudouridine synthase [Bacteroidales bacterium]|nr:pseudouridine synthase [Bacteroidales bacterium]